MNHTNTYRLNPRIETPWGVSQHHTDIAPGLRVYRAASHGGIHVVEARNAQIPGYLRADTHGQLGERGWYEEDCDWCIPAVVFAAEWRTWADQCDSTSADGHLAAAWDTLRNWHPEGYERWTGKQLQIGESYKADEARFWATHRESFVATVAWGDWHDAVPAGQIAVMARRQTDGEERYFLLTKDEYAATRVRVGTFAQHVVDPLRHQHCPAVR